MKSILAVLLLVASISAIGQIPGRIDRGGPLRNSLELRRQNSMFTIDPGMSLYLGDFETRRPKLVVNLAYEYYIRNRSKFPIFFGIKPNIVFGSYGGYDVRRSDPRFSPTDEFRSDFFNAGFFGVIALPFPSAKMMLYAAGGPSIFYFDAKDNKTKVKLPGNVNGDYAKTIFIASFEGGIKVKIAPEMTLNISGRGYKTVNNDYLDDLKAGLYPDFLVSGHLGVSILFSSRRTARPIGWGLSRKRKFTPRVRF
jgi:hypothetical protein